MKTSPFKFLNLYIFIFLFSFSFVFGQTSSPSIYRTLRPGDSGEDVRTLQIFLNKDKSTTVALYGLGSPGNETTYFGNATKKAVIKFQEKYLYEVLVPAGLRNGTGNVGPLTLAKISTLNAGSKGQNVTASSNNTTGPANLTTNTPVLTKIVPSVTGVIPDKVRSGNIVTINGSNFTSTGNTVRLRYGLLEARFDNLPSSDGKTIMFTFKPPESHVITQSELSALPTDIYNQLVNPVLKAGGSIDDLTNPYRNLNNENDLVNSLSKNGHSFDELYDYFYVTVENSNGEGSTKSAVLYGLRQLPFGEKLSISESLKEGILKISDSFLPKKAHAQKPGGGINSGMIMYCTCSGGFLSFIIDVSGGGGLLYFYPGFVPLAGTGVTPSLWIGYYTPGGGGFCSIYAGLFCIPIPAGIPDLIWGASL